MQTNKTKEKMDGLDIVLAIVAIIGLFFIAFLIWPPVNGGGKNSALRSAAISNAKQIVLAMQAYAEDWDDRLPPALDWETSIKKYVKSERVFILPKPSNFPSHRFAFNAKLSEENLKLLENSDSTVLVFETDSPVESAFGGKELVRAFPESKVTVVGFGDLHVKLEPVEKISSLIWKPTFMAQIKSSPAKRTK